MKAAVGKLASTFLIVGLFCIAPRGVYAHPVQAERGVITGELVAINGTRNQFRLVDHAGSFTAPPGISVDALDGKPVQVELGRDGRVLQITEMAIPINPVAHGEEVVTGLMTIRDPIAGSFSIAGEGRVYVAPAGIDIRPYAGRMVEVHLDEQGRMVSIDLSSRSAVAPPPGPCWLDGRSYAEGEASCQSGMQYRCDYGAWRSLGVECPVIAPQACNVGGIRYLEGATRCEQGAQFACERGQWRSIGTACSFGSAGDSPARTCAIGGATVADGSSICRDGTAYRCASGQWISVGKACS